MHAALYKYDILRQIFDTFDCMEDVGWEDGRDACKSLAAAARTCTVVSEPALDVLWRRQDALDPLLNLLIFFRKIADDEHKAARLSATPAVSFTFTLMCPAHDLIFDNTWILK